MKMVQQTETKATSKQGIGYSGVVTVTIKKGNRVISKKTTHNNSTPLLFRALCMCLVGDNVGLTFMPRYLDALDNNGTSVLGALSYLTTRYVYSSSSADSSSSVTYSARFITTINFAQLSSDITITQLALCVDALGASQLATITLATDSQIQLEDSNYTALIEWDMQFQDVASTISNDTEEVI